MKKSIKLITAFALLFTVLVSSTRSSYEVVNAKTSDTIIKEKYINYIEEISDQYGICPEFIEAMIEYESCGNPKAVSRCGAVGLMQILPKWNKQRMKRLGVTDLYDPYSNILVGVDLVAELFEKYEDPYTVLMCYNEGEYGTAIERAEAGKWSKYAKNIVDRSYELEVIHGKIDNYNYEEENNHE